MESYHQGNNKSGNARPDNGANSAQVWDGKPIQDTYPPYMGQIQYAQNPGQNNQAPYMNAQQPLYPQNPYTVYQTPQGQVNTGAQPVVYNAPMMPQDPLPSYPTPQTGKASAEAKQIRIGEKKKMRLQPMAIAGTVLGILAIVVIAFLVFGGKKAYTAKDVVEALYRHGLPITNATVYTSDTDPDGLLGKMNQYTSKVSWTDTSVSGAMTTLECGGMVEVFDNEDLAQQRLRLLNSMMEDQSGRCSCVNRAVMRLSPLLSEARMAEYEAALRSMFGK